MRSFASACFLFAFVAFWLNALLVTAHPVRATAIHRRCPIYECRNAEPGVVSATEPPASAATATFVPVSSTSTADAPVTLSSMLSAFIDALKASFTDPPPTGNRVDAASVPVDPDTDQAYPATAAEPTNGPYTEDPAFQELPPIELVPALEPIELDPAQPDV